MSNSSLSEHEKIQQSVAEDYRRDGYEVSVEPGPKAIPFDLGAYTPDLIARKGDLNLIVEIRTQTERISFEGMRSIAGEVRKHEGWRFILVTTKDIPSIGLPGENEDPFTWDAVSRRIEDADRLSDLGQKEAAFLILWIEFERMMRFQARRIALPYDRRAASALIPPLYSLGDLSISQYDDARTCQAVRNRLVHGFPAGDISDAVTRLGALVRDVAGEWSAPESED